MLPTGSALIASVCLPPRLQHLKTLRWIHAPCNWKLNRCSGCQKPFLLHLFFKNSSGLWKSRRYEICTLQSDFKTNIWWQQNDVLYEIIQNDTFVMAAPQTTQLRIDRNGGISFVTLTQRAPLDHRRRHGMEVHGSRPKWTALSTEQREERFFFQLYHNLRRASSECVSLLLSPLSFEALLPSTSPVFAFVSSVPPGLVFSVFVSLGTESLVCGSAVASEDTSFDSGFFSPPLSKYSPHIFSRFCRSSSVSSTWKKKDSHLTSERACRLIYITLILSTW